MKKPTSRLDAVLVAKGLAASRERARALILAGHVRVDGQVVSKAGRAVAPDADVALIARDHPYVSRGGVKLAHALDALAVDVATVSCSTSAPRRAGSLTSCSVVDRRASWRSTSATGSWTGASGAMRV